MLLKQPLIKVKKYKVLVKFPGFPLDKGDIFECSRSGGKFAYIERVNWCRLDINPAEYPDVFEEVKEPLFLSKDGYPVYKGEKILKCYIIDELRGSLMTSHNLTFSKAPNGLNLFLNREAAEAYYKEVCVRYSIADIKEAMVACACSEEAIEIITNKIKSKNKLV